MNAAIISDIHLGDSLSAMVYRDMHGEIRVGDKYYEMRDRIRQRFPSDGESLDYLILAGDIFDFSVSSYSESYQMGKIFFQHLKDDHIAEQIIYLPGNHDFDLWNTVEYEVNVIHRIKENKTPLSFKMSVPAIIDCRRSSPIHGLTLHKVKPQLNNCYGGLFLDNITTPSTQFNFAFPNLYIITDKETVIVTHGQYLEPFWSMMGEWSLRIFGDDIKLGSPGKMDIYETVSLNVLLSVMGCSALGQAGPLTPLIQKMQHEFKEHKLERIDNYLGKLGKEMSKGKRWPFSLLLRAAWNVVKKEAVKQMSRVNEPRYNENFIYDPKVRERFANYFASTVLEIKELSQDYGIEIPLPEKMIFGHTHQPVGWDSPEAPGIYVPQLPEGHKIKLYNTGGWLHTIESDGVYNFCGAEIFFYSDNEIDGQKGFFSETIGQELEEIFL